jgi:phosphopantothenoylcysteine synthetase/decarboxylase
MKVIITAGPSYEPIDRVRRLTNFSSGELGTLLSEAFAAAGHQVVCFRGEASTFPPPLWPVEVVPFKTNDDLESNLRRLLRKEDVAIVFHVAALCDFRVSEIADEKGSPLDAGKISSRDGALKLTLEPMPKLIASLRRMFPASLLVGWKYEIDGSTDDVVAKGRKQMDDYLTDVSVLNGSAYGSGFGVIARSGERAHLPDKSALCSFLLEWAERMPIVMGSPRPESFHALASFMPLAPFI